MTISSETNSRVTYAGTNNDASTFEVTFLDYATYSTSALVEDNIKVYIQDANGVVTEITTNTGEATYWSASLDPDVDIQFNVAIPLTSTIIIDREVPRTQETNYVANDAFPAQAHEDALDKLTRIGQNLQQQIDRSFRFSQGSTSTITPISASASDRAGKILGFDSNGDFIVDQEIGEYQGDWAASTAYAVRDIIKDTSNNNIYLCNTAHTSSGSQPISSNTDSAKWDLLVDAASATASAAAAAASESAASASESAAAASESAAASSESAAYASQVAAAASETAAGTSELNASSSEAAALVSETNAATSESNASTSASAASSSASAAASSASAAATSESNAATSESNASTSETNAATSEGNALTYKNAAETAQTGAETAQTGAQAAQSAAESARDSALAAYDNFDDRYLGAKASDPTLDNDGDALIAGALYFNTTDEEMKLYTGSAWVVAYVSGGGFLASSNNLSDLADTATAVSNLGLTGALKNVVEDTSPELGGNLTVSGYDIVMGDDDKITFGASSDLQMYHLSSFNLDYIDSSATSGLQVSSDGLFYLKHGLDDAIKSIPNGQVSLYYNGSESLKTISNGVAVKGTLQLTGASSPSRDVINTGLGLELDCNGIMQLEAGSDLYLLTNGTENAIYCNANGSVDLYHNNSVRLQTTGEGVDVSGTGSLKLPEGTTAQRPASPTQGDIRYNTDTNAYESYREASGSNTSARWGASSQWEVINEWTTSDFEDVTSIDFINKAKTASFNSPYMRYKLIIRDMSTERVSSPTGTYNHDIYLWMNVWDGTTLHQASATNLVYQNVVARYIANTSRSITGYTSYQVRVPDVVYTNCLINMEISWFNPGDEDVASGSDPYTNIYDNAQINNLGFDYRLRSGYAAYTSQTNYAFFQSGNTVVTALNTNFTNLGGDRIPGSDIGLQLEVQNPGTYQFITGTAVLLGMRKY